MDRKAFLDSLPFLIPLPSSSWPPKSPRESGDEKSYAEATLVDHCLSIEPLAELSDGVGSFGSVGPAFFVMPRGRQTEDSDPAMCGIDMVMYVSGDCASNVEPGNKLSPSHRSPKAGRERATNEKESAKKVDEQNNGDRADLSYAVGYFHIDGHVYQLDHRYCKRAISVGGSSHSSSTPRTGIPPCLVLEFSTCIFRVFYRYPFDESKKSIPGQSLEAMQNLFAKVILESPNISFPTIVIDFTQQEEIGMPNSNEESGRKVCFMVPKPASSSKACSNAANRKRKFESFHQKLGSLHRSLTNPSPDDDCKTLLSELAADMASSYCPHEDIASAVRDEGTVARAHRTEMDAIYESFFPVFRQAKRGRRGRRGARSPLMQQKQEQKEQQSKERPSPEQLVANVQELLRKHKKSVQSSYSSLLLPLRG